MSQRIFITGGASGLGLAIAAHYHATGWRVAIGDINQDGLEKAKSTLGHDLLCLTCDVTQMADVENAVTTLKQAWDGIDVVVNNAGVATAGGIEEHALDDWEWVTNINLLGVVRGCKAFTPLFREQGHGHFVNIASMAGLIHPPLMASYNATKAAVVALSETLEIELSQDNIGVSVACPGFFRTNLGDGMRSDLPGMQPLLDKLFSRSKITAEDVAAAIFKAVEQRDFFILPHAEGRKAHLLKRILPHKQYAKIIQKQSSWLLRQRSS